jgi:pseudaminic acid synthase
MAAVFQVPIGLSDHSLGIAVPVAAVALGATIIEKHLTLRRADGGPDAAFSLEPGEFRAMVEAIRAAERSLGSVCYKPLGMEKRSAGFRRSLFVVQDIKAGEAITGENVRSIRPGLGLHPRHLTQVTGRRANRDLKKGTPLDWQYLGPALAVSQESDKE